MDDYARALAENLLKSLDHFIESAWHVIFSDSFAFENPVDLVPNSLPQQGF
jgi:hypothetical protein